MAIVYQRPHALVEMPTHYCPGCTHGVIHKLVAEVIDELDVEGRTVGIAPVGCAVMAYDYFACDMVEAAHGRAPAIATGIKRSLPDSVVFTYQGDGDLAAIGTAETVHAATRGEDITIIFVNNGIYGMTGGQMAPTGVAYAERVAVDSVPNIRKAKAAIKKAFTCQIEKKGFSIVEILSTCPTNWGLTPVEALQWLRDNMMPYYPLGVYADKTEKGVRP